MTLSSFYSKKPLCTKGNACVLTSHSEVLLFISYTKYFNLGEAGIYISRLYKVSSYCTDFMA